MTRLLYLCLQTSIFLSQRNEASKKGRIIKRERFINCEKMYLRKVVFVLTFNERKMFSICDCII